MFFFPIKNSTKSNTSNSIYELIEVFLKNDSRKKKKKSICCDKSNTSSEMEINLYGLNKDIFN